MAAGKDRIEKQVVLKAPLARVWRAVSDAAEFGSWFGVRFDGGFAPGARLPPERRAEAFEANAGGWEAQTRLVEKYLAGAPAR